MERDKQVSQGPDQKAAAGARTRLLKAGRSLGKILGTVVAPVDVAIELAFAVLLYYVEIYKVQLMQVLLVFLFKNRNGSSSRKIWN